LIVVIFSLSIYQLKLSFEINQIMRDLAKRLNIKI
jgi:hypothetical protein